VGRRLIIVVPWLVLCCGCHLIFPFRIGSDMAISDGARSDTTADIARSDTATTTPDAGSCPCISCEHKQLVFVTSATYTGAMGGLSGADQACDNLAKSAGRPGTFRAWLSDSSTDARDRVTGGPWYTVHNGLVACDIAELTTTGVRRPLNLTEKGGASPTSLVWTGTDYDGTADAHAEHDLCSDWTSAVDSPEALVGRSDLTGKLFTMTQSAWCSHSLAVYCFQVAP
jgi:hypothetical protein